MRPPLRPTLLALATLLVIGLIVALVLGDTSQNSTSNPSPSPTPTTTPTTAGSTSVTGFDGAALPSGILAPPWTLSDPAGRRVALGDYRGEVVILAFLTPTAGVSQLIAQQIRGALDDLKRPTPAVAISAAPQLDARARVERFLTNNALRGRLTYLTGSAAQLRALWRAYHVVPLSAGRARFEDAATVLLIDGRGYERVLYGVEQLTPQSLAHDVERLRDG
jgi:cytochrome oxidase Cu insertion factor (SCO1/SenC/PrrC family)